MAAKKTVTVRILDQALTFATDASPERVEKIAALVNQNLSSAIARSKSGSPYQAAILSALNIAEKYFEMVEKQTELKSRVAEKSKKILGLLESTNSKAPQDP